METNLRRNNAPAIILVVSQKDDLVKMVKDYLDQAGYQVLITDNGNKAIEIIYNPCWVSRRARMFACAIPTPPGY